MYKFTVLNYETKDIAKNWRICDQTISSSKFSLRGANDNVKLECDSRKDEFLRENGNKLHVSKPQKTA